MPYPPKLQALVDFFSPLAENERRENLIAFAGAVKKHAPRDDETYAIADVRKDEECADTVGIFVRLDQAGRVHLRVSLGPEVQTLTRAMAAILCGGLDGCTPEEILALPSGFVPLIAGGQLARIRSQTVYYVLNRMKTACHALRERLRAEA